MEVGSSLAAGGRGSRGFALRRLGAGLAVLPFVLLWTVLIAVVPGRERDA